MSKKSILLIEDDVWLADLERTELLNAGYTVTVAHNALEAIDAIDTTPPDVIVADVLLVGTTVFTLLNELQSYSDTGTIPVVLYSGIAEQFSSSQLEHYGVRRVVDKTTMERDALAVAVRSVLGGAA